MKNMSVHALFGGIDLSPSPGKCGISSGRRRCPVPETGPPSARHREWCEMKAAS